MKQWYLDALPPHTITYFPPNLDGRGILWDGGWMCCNTDYSRQYLMLMMNTIRYEEVYLAVRETTNDRLPRKDIEVTFQKENKDAWPLSPIGYEILSPRRYYLTETLAVEGIDNHERWSFPHRMEYFDGPEQSWRHPIWGKIIATIQLEEEVFFLKAEQGSGLMVSLYYEKDDDPLFTLPYEKSVLNFRSYTWPHEEICQSHPHWHEVICRFLELERHF